MKTLPIASRRGMALVLVLSLLVLVTGIVVGFLVRAGGERTASANYYASASARQLADTAVNLVQAQINEATTLGSGTYAWASQPGAVRVFDNTGSLKRIFRLYSASSMVTTGADPSVLQNDLPPTDWSGSHALWTDLNAPVTISSGTTNYSVYPVLDPRDPANPGTVAAPIVTSTMPGFSLSGTVPGATTRQPVPMPVRWLYVLQDGKISVPTASGTGAVSVPDASSSNPIVGRIAFWTDDECAKVNINTAAGSFSSRNGSLLPAPWDTPRFKIWEERLLFSEDQPVKGEFQRYPGHPATTDLYGILHALDVATTGYPTVISNYSSSQPPPSSTPSALSKMLPYYADDNTSQGGASLTTNMAPGSINGGVSKKDRLYTSLGELLYDPQRNATLTGGGADGTTVNPRQQLESGKFFLTAHSRGPEVTLFGTPRVCMWPVSSQTGSNYRTSYDRLAAFCSTTGTSTNPLIYYIQRQNPRSATEDYDQISRNQDIYKYLLRLGAKEIPGFGGNFASKYSSSHEWDQILTEMIDYIRCTNLSDHSVSSTNSSFVRYTSTPTGLTGGKGQVVPLKIVENGVTTHGLGRLPTISEIGIQIICTADGNGPDYQSPVTPSGFAKKVSPVYGSSESAAYVSNLPEEQLLRASDGSIVDTSGSTVTAASSGSATAFPSNPTLATEYGGTLTPLSQGQKRLQAMLLFELSAPMMGFDTMDMTFSGASIFGINVAGINGVSIAGQTPFPDRTPTGSTGAAQNGNGAMMAMTPRFNAIQSTGGLLGFRYLLNNTNNGVNQRYNGWSGVSPSGSVSGPYRYVSNPFTVSASGTTSTTLLGGGFTAALRVAQTGSNANYQTFNVTFPSATIPVPDLPQNGLAGTYFTNTAYISNKPADWWGFDKRIGWAKYYSVDGYTSAPNLAPGCVIRSDKPVSGTWNYSVTTSVPLVTAMAQPALSDVVRTMVVRDGDYRVVAGLENVDVSGGSASPFDLGPNYNNSSYKLGNIFKDNFSALATAGVDNSGKLVNGAGYSWQLVPKVPSGMDSKKQTTWDWDTGLPAEPDGAYANKPDEGNIFFDAGSTSVNRPYYNRESQISGTAFSLSSYFTANRIINSPVMFGSLPTGVKENISWRTLLFRPQQNRYYDPSGPKDHLLLDLFTMPVVEPYAISEPFSTAGKINLNYQIVPFTYIKRSTGLRAVLGSELIARVPKAAAAAQASYDYHTYYKEEPSSSNANSTNAIQSKVSRLPIDLDQTLLQCESKFSLWELYKSPSEICDIYLVPQGYTWSDASTFDAIWYGDDFALVGDNVRERPYSDIYPRLTTKSNTYTVHFKVQALKNPTSARQDTWTEATGSVTAEYQGSTTVERYLDPSNVSIPDYTTNTSADSLDNYYQWRTVANEAFNP
ncbi:MAG: Verru_Chthon cassette protein A [Chthoniobacteraceae bacterium]